MHIPQCFASIKSSVRTVLRLVCYASCDFLGRTSLKTIGLLGGMSWESTELYYRLINEATRARRGGLHSAPIVMNSLDFAPIEALQMAGDWDGAASVLCRAARGVEAGGADFLLICTNTMHHIAKDVAAAINIPLLHLGDATARHVVAAGVQKVGLLGTRFTMEMPFYRDRLAAHGLDVVLPEDDDRGVVHDIIYTELCKGVVSNSSRSQYLRIINALADSGAQAIILGCTEIGMLIKPADTSVALFDTTQIHVDAAVDAALADTAS